MRRLLLIVGLIALAVAIGFTVLPLFFRSGPVVEVFPLDPEVLALSAPATPLSGVPTLPSSASATASPIPVHASIPSVAFVQQGLDGYEGCVDTYIQFYLPDENFCGGHELSVGSNNKAAVLLRFDLTELPETAYGLNSEAIVQQATLSLYGVQGTRDTAISTYVARREWEACAITWNQPWQEPGADGELDRDAESWQEVVSPRMPGWLEFDVTELVQSWLREPASNLGLMIKSFDARWPSHHIFFASDHPATTSRPKLTIEYQPVRATRTQVSPTDT
jgi:hypothetical protein